MILTSKHNKGKLHIDAMEVKAVLEQANGCILYTTVGKFEVVEQYNTIKFLLRYNKSKEKENIFVAPSMHKSY